MASACLAFYFMYNIFVKAFAVHFCQQHHADWEASHHHSNPKNRSRVETDKKKEERGMAEFKRRDVTVERLSPFFLKKVFSPLFFTVQKKSCCIACLLFILLASGSFFRASTKNGL